MTAEVDTSPHTFKERLGWALAEKNVIDPRQIVTYNGESYEIRDLPSVMARFGWGYGHHPVDVRHREHLSRPDAKPWLYTPETCLVAGAGVAGVWIDAEHLACPGCGLDFT
jgi:hypothetical protein